MPTTGLTQPQPQTQHTAEPQSHQQSELRQMHQQQTNSQTTGNNRHKNSSTQASDRNPNQTNPKRAAPMGAEPRPRKKKSRQEKLEKNRQDKNRRAKRRSTEIEDVINHFGSIRITYAVTPENDKPRHQRLPRNKSSTGEHDPPKPPRKTRSFVVAFAPPPC